MKKRNTVFYYLQINDNMIIDFRKNEIFMNMEDYLRLNIFTSLFSGKNSLILFLKKLGLLDINVEEYKVSIVRRRKSTNGYRYEYITDNIPYKNSLPLLSISKLKEFIKLNKDNYELMYEFISYYRDPIENKINRKEENIEYLKDNYLYKDKLEKEVNSLNFFRTQATVINMLLATLNKLIKGEKITKNHHDEYVENLNNFLENEVYYKKNNKRTENNRGIVKMAKFITSLSKKRSLILPNGDLPNRKVIKEFEGLITDYNSKFSKSLNEVFNDRVDPDSFMFIETDDYSRLHKESESEDIRESIEVDIENLEEKHKL